MTTDPSAAREFYQALGFAYTGEKLDDELLMKLEL